MKRVLVVFGTRPEAIKVAPVVRALKARDAREVELVTCSTAQHREMLDATLRVLDMRPDVDLELMKDDQRPSDVLGRCLLVLRPVLEEVKPDVMAVQGDTTTVMGAALAGFMHGVRVAHIEAGLRTHDRRAPFPEEVNRRVTDIVADLHFAPTPSAREALRAEGVAPPSIFVTGNTGIDALHWMRERVEQRPLPGGIDPGRQRLVLVTAHRRESFGRPLESVCHALRQLAERFDDIEIVFPVHLNPNVQKLVRALLGGLPRIHLTDPVDYADMVALLSRAHLVLTDSGGIQEEAPALGKPVLVLREKTERAEAIHAGVARLVGTDRSRIVAEAARLLEDDAAYGTMARVVNVFGDGRAATRIAEILVDGRMTTPAFEPTPHGLAAPPEAQRPTAPTIVTTTSERSAVP